MHHQHLLPRVSQPPACTTVNDALTISTHGKSRACIHQHIYLFCRADLTDVRVAVSCRDMSTGMSSQTMCSCQPTAAPSSETSAWPSAPCRDPQHAGATADAAVTAPPASHPAAAPAWQTAAPRPAQLATQSWVCHYAAAGAAALC